MIDISQWRTSIGLWYYQICDNVIDKSLPALCRKGTRAKKQSSNEKHSQTNRNSTAVEQISSNEIPQYRAYRRNKYSNPVVSNGQTPVASSNVHTQLASTEGQTPVASTNGHTPALSTNGETLIPSTNGHKTVVLSNDETQVASTNGYTPILSINSQSQVVLSNVQAPIASAEGQTPVHGQTPIASSIGQTPVESTDIQTPVLFTKGQIQVASSNGQTPVVLSNSSTANTTMRYADWCGRVQTISLAVFLFLLLILSGDIELNPGPKTGK